MWNGFWTTKGQRARPIQSKKVKIKTANFLFIKKQANPFTGFKFWHMCIEHRIWPIWRFFIPLYCFLRILFWKFRIFGPTKSSICNEIRARDIWNFLNRIDKKLNRIWNKNVKNWHNFLCCLSNAIFIFVQIIDVERLLLTKIRLQSFSNKMNFC